MRVCTGKYFFGMAMQITKERLVQELAKVSQLFEEARNSRSE